MDESQTYPNLTDNFLNVRLAGVLMEILSVRTISPCAGYTNLNSSCFLYGTQNSFHYNALGKSHETFMTFVATFVKCISNVARKLPSSFFLFSFVNDFLCMRKRHDSTC